MSQMTIAHLYSLVHWASDNVGLWPDGRKSTSLCPVGKVNYATCGNLGRLRSARVHLNFSDNVCERYPTPRRAAINVKKKRSCHWRLTLRDLSSLAVRRNLPPGCQEIPKKKTLVEFRKLILGTLPRTQLSWPTIVNRHWLVLTSHT